MAKRELTLEEKLQRTLDYQEIQNLMSEHMHYHSAGMHGEEMEKNWAKKHTISGAQNGRYFIGWESNWNYYVGHHDNVVKRALAKVRKLHPEVEDKPENYSIGTLVVHPLTSPIIVVAGDGQTAKGVWYSPGQVTEIGADGKPFAQWMWEKYGVDFVKEDGEWKIWHIHMYYDFACPVGEVWTEPASKGDELADLGPEEERMEMPKPDLDIPDVYKGYSPTTVPQMIPRLPEPYETFSETFSYGPPE